MPTDFSDDVCPKDREPRFTPHPEATALCVEDLRGSEEVRQQLADLLVHIVPGKLRTQVNLPDAIFDKVASHITRASRQAGRRSAVDFIPKTLDDKLTKVVEECAEVIKEICKAERFGLDTRWDALCGCTTTAMSVESNREAILREVHDLEVACNALRHELKPARVAHVVQGSPPEERWPRPQAYTPKAPRPVSVIPHGPWLRPEDE